MARDRFPRLDDGVAFRRFRADADAWRAAVVDLLRDHDLASAPLEDLGGGTLVVGVGGERVLKLAPPIFGRQITAEVAALRHVEGRLPVETPGVLAYGTRDDWPWLLMTRVRGGGVRACWSSIDAHARAEIARTVGRTLAALHALEAPGRAPLDDPWSDFVAKQRAACIERQRKWGVPEEILAGIPALFARADLEADAHPPLLHADLTHENVLVEKTGDAWRVSAVIDFGDARRGDRAYDLITPALLITRGERDLFHALLDGYALAPSQRDDAFLHRLTASAVLHPFNDLTRYLRFDPSASSLDALARAMFPL